MQGVLRMTPRIIWIFFFSSRRRHTRLVSDWSSDGALPISSGRAPVVLTHDIDSPEGLKNLVARFLPLEEAVGARSTSYIVPCAWPLDHSLIAELVAREIGRASCRERG